MSPHPYQSLRCGPLVSFRDSGGDPCPLTPQDTTRGLVSWRVVLGSGVPSPRRSRSDGAPSLVFYFQDWWEVRERGVGTGPGKPVWVVFGLPFLWVSTSGRPAAGPGFSPSCAPLGPSVHLQRPVFTAPCGTPWGKPTRLRSYEWECYTQVRVGPPENWERYRHGNFLLVDSRCSLCETFGFVFKGFFGPRVSDTIPRRPVRTSGDRYCGSWGGTRSPQTMTPVTTRSEPGTGSLWIRSPRRLV